MKKFACVTLGCRANQYQTFGLKCQMTNDKCQIVDFSEIADIYVINTCAVTADAGRKSRQAIRRALRQNPNAKIIVTGCYAKLEKAFIKKEFPQIEILESSFFCPPLSIVPRIRANLMIQDGCQHFCSYCIVPYARGKVKSKPIERVVLEAKRLVKAGAREIVLSGINLGTYGTDNSSSLSAVLCLPREESRGALSSIKELIRIRLSSIEPMYINKELIDTLANNPKACEHFHIPLQSGDNSILKRMNRGYTPDDYLEMVDYIRSKNPDCAITTDIIVGFPGEGEREFQNTVDLVNKIRFSRIHVFPYSRRKGTPAADFLDQVDPETKRKRSKILHELRTKYMMEFAGKYLKTEVEILVEQKGQGLTSNYIRILYPGKENEIGKLKKIRIKEIKDEFCLGY